MNRATRFLLYLTVVPLFAACGASPDDVEQSAQALTTPRLVPGSAPGLFHDQRNDFDCRFSGDDPSCRPLSCYEPGAGRIARNPATGRFERMVAVAKGKLLPRFGNWGESIPTGCIIHTGWPFRLELTPVTEALNWPAEYPMSPLQLSAYDFYRANYEGCVSESGAPIWCEGATQKELPPGCTVTGCLTIAAGF